MDHYKNPRHHQLLDGPDLKSEGFNPFCGDRVVLTVKLDSSGRISEVGFTGQGCAISQASANDYYLYVGLVIADVVTYLLEAAQCRKVCD